MRDARLPKYLRHEGIGVITGSIPLPPKRDQRIENLPVSALLRRMRVGDSVALPRCERENIYARARALKIRVSVRLMESEVIRVWRIED
jgi:hypothetical protein